MTFEKMRRKLLAWLLLAPLGLLAALGYYRLPAAPAPDVAAPRPVTQEPAAPAVEGIGLLPARPAAAPELDPPIDESRDTAAYEPESWRGSAEYTLRLHQARMTFPGAAHQGGPAEVEVLTYNGRLVGPTLRVRRGTTVKINLHNELPATGAPPVTVLPQQVDRPHDLYTTNLHAHGLHLGPREDDVFRAIRPGAASQYTYTIPADHPAGTFWYHPHKHGSVAYQIGNGLAGALIVEGDSGDPARNLDAIPEIARAQERVFVFQQFVFQRDRDGTGRVDPNDVYTVPPSPDSYQATVINGVVVPTYVMQPGEVQRWRFIHAGREEPLDLQWRDALNRPMRRMPFYEIAVDGLATGTIQPLRRVKLFPGNRSDVLVQAPSERGVYLLGSEVEQEGDSVRNVRGVIKPMAKLIVRGPERDMALPREAQLAPCRAFAPIDPGECRVKREVVFASSDKAKFFHINGQSFRTQTGLDEPLLNTAEEWTLRSADTAVDSHPFHIHVNPFEVVQIEDVSTKRIWKVHQWRDTISVDPGKRVTIRIRFRDFPGKTVFHCHTLDHEDQGMMRTLRIVDPARPGADPDDPAALLTETRAPAPPLQLPTAGAAPWELAALRPRPVVLVFFQGMGCSHCTESLRELLQAAGALADTGTALVAVSSAPIADPAQALAALPAPAGLRFDLLVDASHRGFRAFDCYDGGPCHGLFLIDPAGTVRARYVGNVPYTDPAAAVRRLRQLLAADATARAAALSQPSRQEAERAVSR